MATIGLFGGTFNPIHLGHIKTVLEVKNSFRLETVYLIPAFQPPHKTNRKIAAAADRMAMLKIAVARLDGLEISGTEITRSGLSYSVETVNEFHQRFAGTTGLAFILGLDAFIEIHTWKAYLHLFEQVSFIVMTRPRTNNRQAPSTHTTLQSFLDARISDGYVFESSTGCFRHPALQPVRLFETTPVDISSTAIRRKIPRKQPFGHLLPEGVADYIIRKGLYQ